jgi:Flp pilus assembly protein TadG
MQLRQARRSGTTILESAIIYPLVIFLVLALVVGAMGVFRYQQVANLAREGARYALVHGTDYARENNQPAATAQDILDNAVLPRAVSLEPAKLNCTVTWDESNGSSHSIIVDGRVVAVANTVSVTVTYQWLPELYLAGPIVLSSTSVMPMSY